MNWSILVCGLYKMCRICHVAAVYLIIFNVELSTLHDITLMRALPLWWHADRRRNFVRIPPLFKLLQRIKATLPLCCPYLT